MVHSVGGVSLQVPAKTGGGTCGDTRHVAVCLGRLERADVNCYCHKSYCVIRPANTWKYIYANNS